MSPSILLLVASGMVGVLSSLCTFNKDTKNQTMFGAIWLMLLAIYFLLAALVLK